MLMKLRADPNACCEEDKTTAIWHATYHNHPDLVKYLVDCGADIEVPVSCLGNHHVRHTPLHWAAREGYAQLTRILLEARANHSVTSIGLWTPIDSAIAARHAQVVELLLKHGAKLVCRQLSMSRRDVRRMRQGPSLSDLLPVEGLGNHNMSSLDLLWAQASPTLALAVARGLAQNPDQLDQLETKDLMQFLEKSKWDQAPGTHLANVLFKQIPLRDLVYRDYEESGDGVVDIRPRMMYWPHLRRRTFEDGELKCNVLLGPSASLVKELYAEDDGVSPMRVRRFFKGLLPEPPEKALATRSRASTWTVVPVKVFMCRFPHLQEDINVLIAITRGGTEICAQPGIQALLKHWWRNLGCRAHLQRHTVLECFWVAYGVCLTIILRCSATLNGEWVVPALWWLSIIGAFPLMCEFGEELLQMVGFAQLGHWSVYFRHRTNIYDLLLIIATGLMLLVIRGPDGEHHFWWRCLEATVVCMRWLQLLRCFANRKATGPSMLPVILALSDIKGFAFLAFLVTSAVFNAWVLLGFKYDLVGEVSDVYRMTFLSDADPSGLLDDDPSPLNHSVALGFVVFSTAMVSILLLNILITVLMNKYNMVASNILGIFMHFRAVSILDSHATDMGLKVCVSTLTCGLVAPTGDVKLVGGALKPKGTKSDLEEDDQSWAPHLWYATPDDGHY